MASVVMEEKDAMADEQMEQVKQTIFLGRWKILCNACQKRWAVIGIVLQETLSVCLKYRKNWTREKHLIVQDSLH